MALKDLGKKLQIGEPKAGSIISDERILDRDMLSRELRDMILQVDQLAQTHPLLHDLAVTLRLALDLNFDTLPSSGPSHGKEFWRELQRLRFQAPDADKVSIDALESKVAQVYYYWLSYIFADTSDTPRVFRLNYYSSSGHAYGVWMRLFWGESQGQGFAREDGFFNMKRLSRVNPLWLAAVSKVAKFRLDSSQPGKQPRQRFYSPMAVRLNIDLDQPYDIGARIRDFTVSDKDGIAVHREISQTGLANLQQRIDLGNLAAGLLPPRLVTWAGLKPIAAGVESKSASSKANWSAEVSGVGPKVRHWLAEQAAARLLPDASRSDSPSLLLAQTSAETEDRALPRAQREPEIRARQEEMAMLISSLSVTPNFRFIDQTELYNHIANGVDDTLTEAFRDTGKNIEQRATHKFHTSFGYDRQPVLSDGDYFVCVLDQVRLQLKSTRYPNLSSGATTAATLNFFLTRLVLSPYLKPEIQFALLAEFLDDFQELTFFQRHFANDSRDHLKEFMASGRLHPVLSYIHTLRWLESRLGDDHWLQGQKIRLALYEQALAIKDWNSIEALEPDTLFFDTSRIISGAHPKLRSSEAQIALMKRLLDGGIVDAGREVEILAEPILLDMIFFQLQVAKPDDESPRVAEELFRQFVNSLFSKETPLKDEMKRQLIEKLRLAFTAPALRHRLDLDFVNKLADEITAFGSWLDRVSAE